MILADRLLQAPRRFLAWLAAPRPSPSLYVLKIWLVQFVGNVLYLAVLNLLPLLFGQARLFEGLPVLHRSASAITFMLMVLIAPAVETLVMIPVFWLLRRVSSRKSLLIGASAVIWGGLHALGEPLQGITVLWGFVLLSAAFVAWWEKSLRLAYWVTFSLHALFNLFGFTLRLNRAGAPSLWPMGWRILLTLVILFAGAVVATCGLRLLARSHGSSLPEADRSVESAAQGVPS